jgi:hypothetical protein
MDKTKNFNNMMEFSNYFQKNYNIYMFLRECAFRKIYNDYMNNQLSTKDCNLIRNTYSKFEKEKKENNWHFHSVSIKTYKVFLEDIYVRLNINIANYDNLVLAKELTENLSFFGNYDDLTIKRLQFFDNKIKKLNNNHKKEIFDININLKENIIPNNNFLKKNVCENFYNPKNNKNYIPELVDRNIKLPINKSDPNFQNLQLIIIDLIENANQELDYQKVDMAIKNLEAAAYYINNIIY